MSDYAGVLADLRARRSALDQERTELDTAIGAIERLAQRASEQAGPKDERKADAARGISPRAFSGLTMPQAIEKLLRIVQQGQTTRQIQEGLKSGAFRSSSKNFRGHVYNTLHRLSQSTDGPFRREVDGRWGLREWQTEPAGPQPQAINFTDTTAH